MIVEIIRMLMEATSRAVILVRAVVSAQIPSELEGQRTGKQERPSNTRRGFLCLLDARTRKTLRSKDMVEGEYLFAPDGGTEKMGCPGLSASLLTWGNAQVQTIQLTEKKITKGILQKIADGPPAKNKQTIVALLFFMITKELKLLLQLYAGLKQFLTTDFTKDCTGLGGESRSQSKNDEVAYGRN